MNSKDHETGDANKVIQGLWIGPELSVMEQLSITSFLRNGHEYHLYVYDEVKHIPDGTVIKKADDILPPSRIFKYKDRPSYAGFANFFRYKLLLERGGGGPMWTPSALGHLIFSRSLFSPASSKTLICV
jgi:hypothetical protein